MTTTITTTAYMLLRRLLSTNHHRPLPIHTIRSMSSKTIAVLNDADLKDGEMKEIEFGDGKVLLSRLGDKIHATSAFCTHYGAPLAKGVLTSDGRVVCPWHGACFNVCTGDIDEGTLELQRLDFNSDMADEAHNFNPTLTLNHLVQEDAPALDALHSFKAHVSDSKIYVTADPARTLKENKNRAPNLQTHGVESPGPGVVIVGGGAGAIHTVESLKENGYKNSITILSAEDYAPIDRTRLSKALVTDPAKVEWRGAADLKIKYGTTLRTGVSVTAVDSKAKTVTLNGKEQISYDKLVLAPGGVPRRLPVEGANLGNVFVLRNVEHAKLIDAAAKEGKRVVVIGSSFISMELVVALKNRKLASIDVIGMEEYPFENVLGKEVGKGLKQYHETQGVKFHMQAKVQKILPSSDASVVGSVVISDGPTLEADFVVMGVGVAPGTGFLNDSGFALEKDGGIKVDEFLMVPGERDIYAIGDIAHYPLTETSGFRRIEHWNVASNHGRAVGRSIAGRGEPFAKIPIFWSAQGQQLRYAGIGTDYDQVHITGNPSELKFVAYYIKNDKIIAIASMQADPVVTKVSELLRLGLMPPASEVISGMDPLSIDVSSIYSRSQVMG